MFDGVYLLEYCLGFFFWRFKWSYECGFGLGGVGLDESDGFGIDLGGN